MQELYVIHSADERRCSFRNISVIQVIQVKFDKFLLEADPYCRFDYVAFFNGGEKDDSHLIAKYCGDQAPQ